jgi:hypothetical protein
MKYLILLILFFLIGSAKSADTIDNKVIQQIPAKNDNESKNIVVEFKNLVEIQKLFTKSEDGFFVKNASVLIAFGSLMGSVFLWFLNEKGKRKAEIRNRKEERYQKLVTSVKGFASRSSDRNLRQEFIDQLNLSWVYCPDEVVKKGFFFLDMTVPDSNGKDRFSNDEKVKALGELFIEIRKDNLFPKRIKKTKLKIEDFRSIGT